MTDFRKIIAKLNEDYNTAMQKDTPETYSRLSTIFEDLSAYLREQIQEMTKADILEVVDKLKNGLTITPQDKEQIKLWIVGDADYYVKMENNFKDWQNELKRLMDEINTCTGANEDVTTALKLRTLLRDGARVLADIFYYVEQRQRVAAFDASTDEIDPQERGFLIRILEQKINSDDF